MEVPTTACIIGAGPGGIAMGYYLKHRLRCNDFVIFDQNSGPGGTWFSNTYPGCGTCSNSTEKAVLTNFQGCDVPSHFYSYSFALNSDWSRPLCEQGEILDCRFSKQFFTNLMTYHYVSDLNNVVDRFDIRPHLRLSTRVLGATWDESTGTWEVEFQQVRSGHQYKRSFTVLVSACGIFARPKYPNINGVDKYQGVSWHTGKWDWSFDINGKRVAVIGNGCSGCQVIPAIAPKVQHLTHFARSKQWLFERVTRLPRSALKRMLINSFSRIPLSLNSPSDCFESSLVGCDGHGFGSITMSMRFTWSTSRTQSQRYSVPVARRKLERIC